MTRSNVPNHFDRSVHRILLELVDALRWRESDLRGIGSYEEVPGGDVGRRGLLGKLIRMEPPIQG